MEARGENVSGGCMAQYPEAGKLLVHAQTSLDWYLVNSPSPEGMRCEMGERGPVDVDGKARDAFTAWEVHWSWAAGKDSPPRIEYQTRVSLPCWRPSSPPEEFVQKAWNRFFSALVSHENNHLLTFERHLREIEDTARAEQKSGVESERANRRIEEIIENLRRADRDYDQRTKSGRAEGVTFP